MHIEYEISEQDFMNAQRLAIKNSPVLLVRLTAGGPAKQLFHKSSQGAPFLALLGRGVFCGPDEFH